VRWIPLLTFRSRYVRPRHRDDLVATNVSHPTFGAYPHPGFNVARPVGDRHAVKVETLSRITAYHAVAATVIK
jgi:hypothetical protein